MVEVHRVTQSSHVLAAGVAPAAPAGYFAERLSRLTVALRQAAVRLLPARSLREGGVRQLQKAERRISGVPRPLMYRYCHSDHR